VSELDDTDDFPAAKVGHTPGPWTRHLVSPNYIRAGIYDNPSDGTCPALCIVNHWEHQKELYPLLSRGHSEANARLIAAAPALLAVCEKLIEYHNTSAGFDLMDVIDVALEVVAAAKGGPS
jgi:hypothetical protein